MGARLEHANLIVRDIDAAVRFLQTAFPEFGIRADETDPDGTRWVHVGTHETYIALNKSTIEPTARWKPYSGVPGVNHLAYEVDDVEALQQRMTAGGFQDSTPPNNQPWRKRVYFYDPDGNDWEFIQYLTGDPEKRHDYSISDK